MRNTDFNPHARMQDLDAQFEIDKLKVDNIVFDGIDKKDYPDYCDAHIISADYKGIPMDDEEIEELNNDSEFVHEQLIKQLY
jgi:hypothetical protein